MKFSAVTPGDTIAPWSMQNFEHYIDKYYVYWQRLIPNGSSEQVFAPDLGSGRPCVDARHFQGHVLNRTPTS